MHNRESFPDEIPVADAVEQEQETILEPTVSDQDVPPVEADASDWHEQRQEIVGADDDREEYRD
jgi:hypothetical protein